MPERCRLRATYRLQLGPGLGFAQARALVPYLRKLGVSHLYLSPALQARAGSTHGYDVVDPTRLSEELGGEREFRELAGAGLPIILDVVPNHMGIGDENRWWRDPELRERWFDLDPAGGYRRFFDIDDLGAIRQEREEVFETSHAKILQLLAEGLLDGLRVDHPDGLADPRGYLERLRGRGAERVWVEKILRPAHPREALRDWPVSGTVGYEFLNDACALFVEPSARTPMTELLLEATGESRSFGEISLEAQLEQAVGTFARELTRLERLGPFGSHELARGLAGLPIYRTYVEPWSGYLEAADREAITAARMSEKLARALLLEDHGPPGDAAELVTRFQQTSPAIAAKGVEDTAFYRYLRLLCLNEVGGDPDRFGLTVEDFHAANLERAERFPESLLATQTHDTKRSGDVRARLGALTTMTGPWREHVLRWMDIAEALRGPLGAPDPSEQYLLHQTLVGAWPIGRERLESFLLKALREAKRNSSWQAPDEAWEREVLEFSRRLLARPDFLADFEPFAARVARAGERSALGQLLLKLTCPGIPDIYQGDELWLLSLVDPDNRRSVDWDGRRALLEQLLATGRPERRSQKLHVIHRALELRRRRPGAFAGSYDPLPAGPGLCAFTREHQVLVLVAVREVELEQLEPALSQLGLSGRWRDVLSESEHRLERVRSLRELLARDGLALLERL
jgi:(1->4)-alpha-D-glucan 1-alpha-D-glucosylmutase